MDGHGRVVVNFPNDGHPEMCAEVMNIAEDDPRDQILLWDPERLYIYKQDTPFEGNKVYSPIRYPEYNNSNYRAEIGLPHWKDV